jgi:hypothetical protein
LIELPPVDEAEFLAFVGIGQKSKLHLSKFVHDKLMRALQARIAVLRKELAASDPARRRDITAWADCVNGMDLEALVDGYLEQAQNPEIAYPDHPVEAPNVPEMLRWLPGHHQPAGGAAFRLRTLNHQPEGRRGPELLTTARMITRLEIFNLKDYSAGKTAHPESAG